MSENEKKIEEDKAISTVISFVILALFIGISVSGLLENNDNYIHKLFDKDKTAVSSEFLCIVFIVIHHVRLWFGINYIQADESFGNAVTAATRDNNDRKKSIRKNELRLRIILMLSSGAFLYFLKGQHFGILGIAILLSIQSIVLILYNVLYYEIMYVLDKQKAANIFIAIGDMVVVIFTIFLSVYAFLYSNYDDVSGYSITFFSIALGSLMSIFVGECISQYAPAFILNIKKVINAIY